MHHGLLKRNTFILLYLRPLVEKLLIVIKMNECVKIMKALICSNLIQWIEQMKTMNKQNLQNKPLPVQNNLFCHASLKHWKSLHVIKRYFHGTKTIDQSYQRWSYSFNESAVIMSILKVNSGLLNIHYVF